MRKQSALQQSGFSMQAMPAQVTQMHQMAVAPNVTQNPASAQGVATNGTNTAMRPPQAVSQVANGINQINAAPGILKTSALKITAALQRMTAYPITGNLQAGLAAVMPYATPAPQQTPMPMQPTMQTNGQTPTAQASPVTVAQQVMNPFQDGGRWNSTPYSQPTR